MPCYHCKKPSLYQVPLDETVVTFCLDCYFKFAQIRQQEVENAERQINDCRDQIWAISGLPPRGPRFPPRPQPVIFQGNKLTNINVNHSVVGTINTGSIGTVDQSISAIIQLGEPELAEAIKSLSEAILGSNDLTQNQKNEIIESLSVISKEAASPKEVKQNTVALSLLEKVMKTTSIATDIVDICQKWWPVLLSAFNRTTNS